ncbi:hypothetical protein MMPV_005097 [Pyropia vietnamensis]
MPVARRVFLALGANIAPRAPPLTAAVSALASHPDITLTATSGLYRTAPAHIVDQPAYYNAAASVVTTLSPAALLAATQAIEAAAGRPSPRDGHTRRQQRYGPRVLDVDIVAFADGGTFNDPPRLTVPHPRLTERRFVLGPLADVGAGPVRVPGTGGRTVADLLAALPPAPDTVRLMPLPRGRSRVWGAATSVAAILNVTPDSFSDGGRLSTPVSVADEAERLVHAGVRHLDIGGVSTRPGATAVTAAIEADRLLPALTAVRERLCGEDILISADTYRGSVAAAAVAAGADMINDVMGGRGPADGPGGAGTVGVAAATGVPLVLMHSRGGMESVAGVGNGGDDTDTEADGVRRSARELGAAVSAALAVGVPGWALLADPGLGFGKGHAVSAATLRRLADWSTALAGGVARVSGGWAERDDPAAAAASASGVVEGNEGEGRRGVMTPTPWEGARLPLMVGPSRKRFLAAICRGSNDVERLVGKEELDWATAAAVVATVAGGGDIVRVHHEAAVTVARVADVLLRGRDW